MRPQTTNRLPCYVSLIAGSALPFAFAPWHWEGLALLAPFLFCYSLHRLTFSTPLFSRLTASESNSSDSKPLWPNARRQAMMAGALFGLGFFGVGASWIEISIHQFGQASTPLAITLTLIFVSLLALFFVLLGFLFVPFSFESKNPTQTLWRFPLLWMAIEYLRSHLFTGFPWLLLGTSQTDTFLSSWAPILGDIGLSGILCLSAASLLFIYQKRWPLIIVLLCCLAQMTLPQSWTHPIGKPIKVSLIQGNIPQDIKWKPEGIQLSLDRYAELTQEEKGAQLIVWPESAVPLLESQAQNYLEQLDAISKKAKVSVIIGIPRRQGHRDYFNSAKAFGLARGQYDKQHLVPFGEYLPAPFHWALPIIQELAIPLSQFKAGKSGQKLIQLGSLKIAPFICYEVAYGELISKQLPSADLLVAISDDAWFKNSMAPAQHLQIARMQALKTGRYLLFVSNTGITAIIDPLGHLQAQAGQDKVAVVRGTVQGYQGLTPWARCSRFHWLAALRSWVYS